MFVLIAIECKKMKMPLLLVTGVKSVVCVCVVKRATGFSGKRVLYLMSQECVFQVVAFTFFLIRAVVVNASMHFQPLLYKFEQNRYFTAFRILRYQFSKL